MVRGRRGLTALEGLLPSVRELRTLGASVIKIAADGSVTLAFEGAYLPEAAAVSTATAERAAAEERELLMASADED